VNDVFVLDVYVSSGEGKPKESDLRCTVYKRDINRSYVLKTKAARTFFNDVITKFPVLGFSQRSFEDEISAKIGVKECLEHELLTPYPVMEEKKDEVVAHFKYTVLMTNASTQQTTGLPLN
jgi:methionine aminopeptidase